MLKRSTAFNESTSADLDVRSFMVPSFGALPTSLQQAPPAGSHHIPANN